MFLLGYALDPKGWRRLQAQFDPEDDLFSAIASGFSWHANAAVERGLVRGYVGRDERRADIRGRVLFADQIARSAGLPLPISVAYDDFTEDIAENRMVLTATQLLLRLPRIPKEARMRLLRVRAALGEVSLLGDWRGTQAPLITRLNERYAPALRLAELIFAAASVSERVGDVTSTTFVFDMNKAFEDFVTAAFRQSMRSFGGAVRDQTTPYSLDYGALLRLKPDLSWWVGNECRAVLDAKYKAIDEGVMRHPDAYQMLAYCTAYGLARGYLIYAKDTGQESRVHIVRHAGQEIVVTAIDVAKEPDDVILEVEALAERVVAESCGGALRAA